MLSKIKQVTKELWWAAVVSGIISIIFGIVAIAWPDRTLNAFIYLFSIFVIAIAVVVLAQAFTNIRVDRLWWLSMLFAICGISIGVFIMVNPDAAKAFLAVILAVYIFTQSILDLIVASYADDSKSKTPMIAIGIIGLVFGFIVLFRPVLATNAMVWVIGIYILAHGIFTEYYAFKVRSSATRIAKSVSEALNLDDDESIDKASHKPVKEAKIVKKSHKK